MRESLLVLLLLGGCGAVAACGSGTTAPSDVAAGQEFTLAPGTAAVADGLRVAFQRVVTDSRCPADAVCVWAGEVVVEVAAGSGGGEARQLRPGESFTSDGRRVRVVRVEPYPTSASAIAPQDYRATLVVERG